MEYTKIKDLDIYISDGNYSSKYPKSNEFIDNGVPFIRCNNFENNSITKKICIIYQSKNIQNY